VHLAFHQITERFVDGTMPLDGRAPSEPLGHDEARVMAAAGCGAGVTYMLRALVGDLQMGGREALPEPPLDLLGRRYQSRSVNG